MSNWTLFSNHGHVLICLSRDPQARLRDVAADVGITERAVQKIVRDLQDVGMISVTKSGRRNSYRIHQKQPLRHEIEADCTLKDLFRFVNRKKAQKPKKQQEKKAKPKAADETMAAEQAKGATRSEPATAQQAVPAAGDNKKSRAEKKKREKDKADRQQGSLF